MSRPDQVARLKKLDLVLSVQNHLYLAAPSLKKYLGMERASQITPVKTYLDTGLLVVGGTDSPVVPFNPFWQFYHFLTRNTITDGVYGANERVTSRADLLRMITINVANYTGEAAIKGSIEPGKLADFAVLSRTFADAPEARLVDRRRLRRPRRLRAAREVCLRDPRPVATSPEGSRPPAPEVGQGHPRTGPCSSEWLKCMQ